MASQTKPPPRILLVMPAEWPRALLRAALREAGYDALGTRRLSTAGRFAVTEAGRGPIQLVLVDQDALTGCDAADLESLMAQHAEAAAVLLAPATRRACVGPWKHVLRRPVSVADIVALVERLVRLPREARRPLD